LLDFVFLLKCKAYGQRCRIGERFGFGRGTIQNSEVLRNAASKKECGKLGWYPDISRLFEPGRGLNLLFYDEIWSPNTQAKVVLEDLFIE
jgi:hypothetical protein